MTTVLERIMASGMVEDEQGNLHALDSAIRAEEGDRISACIQRYSISRTLEVGCAFGISSLYICEAISKQSNPHHIIIDPFQTADAHRMGVQNLDKAGYGCWQLIEELSEIALPHLFQSGVKIQFALIDGYHTFDQVLLDFYYVDRLLEEGGVVAFDDMQMPAIDRVVRYVLHYPNYSLVESAGQAPSRKSTKRRLYEYVLRTLTRIAPTHQQEKYFDDLWLRPAEELGLGSRLVFLRKSGARFPEGVNTYNAYLMAVKRDFDWYKHF